MTKLCVVMVGMPGLGKSTMIRKFQAATADAFFVYSTDDYITEAANEIGSTYDALFDTQIKTATKVMNMRLEEAIEDGKDVIWDQTNLGVKKRAGIIRRMKQAGYRVECLSFQSPEPGHISDQKEWRNRLEYRSKVEGKTIPDFVMKNMFDSYVLPDVSEGFASVRYMSMWGREVTKPD